MAERIRNGGAVHEGRPVALGELIHTYVREAIEIAVQEELAAALGAERYERRGGRVGYRNGTKPRTLTGPTGPLALTPAARDRAHRGRNERMDLDDRPALPAPGPGGQRGGGRQPT
jgi:transposase-like protein